MQRILITGANRGIGLELARHYLQDSDVQIFAACRNPQNAQQLRELENLFAGLLRIVQIDINSETSIKNAVDTIAAQVDGLDLLINNAGIYPKGAHQSFHLGQLSAADVSEVVTTNSVGPLMVTQAFRQLLQNGERPRVVMISSGLGSLTSATGGSYGYRMSKAAMNMAARVLSHDSAMSGIITITTHPGWVQTDMGGPSAPTTPTESATGLKALFSQLTCDDNGKFLLYDGTELDW